MAKPNETENKGIDDSTKRKLQDSHWQEGLTWRKKQIQIIAQLRRDGIGENEIFKELKKCGLTNNTANRLMDDAEYLGDSEKSVFDMTPEEYESATEYMKRKQLTKECKNCGKPIRSDLTFCSASCIKEYRSKKEEHAEEINKLRCRRHL
jgi:hypothetical protein